MDAARGVLSLKVDSCERHRVYYANNKSVINLKHKRYRLLNKQAINLQHRAYYEQHKQLILDRKKLSRLQNQQKTVQEEYNKAYYIEHKEAIHLYHQQYHLHKKDIINEQRRLRYQSNKLLVNSKRRAKYESRKEAINHQRRNHYLENKQKATLSHIRYQIRNKEAINMQRRISYQRKLPNTPTKRTTSLISKARRKIPPFPFACDLDFVSQLVSYASRHFHVSDPIDWYRVSSRQMNQVGGSAILKYLGGLGPALQVVHPEEAWDLPRFSLRTKKSRQRWVRVLLQQILPSGVELFEDYLHPDLLWDPSTKLPMELDIWVPKFQLALEYQGEQHYHEFSVFNSLASYIKRDIKKKQRCIERGITLVTVPYWWDGKKESLACILFREIPQIFARPRELLTDCSSGFIKEG
eukprot:TRINITY_DN4792_c0_g1_i1.p1 TRINITY_DN4792_c0_g1~~TRINITY_DN4792_c0_g1_i1.p1  ORF type:complete len:410 (-),score=76.14 TRINITY_DN4792_c0_g1_i1:20-1249(-)